MRPWSKNGAQIPKSKARRYSLAFYLIEVFKSKKDLSNINGVLRFGRSGLNIISKSNGSTKIKTFKRNFINERVKSFWNQLPNAVKNSLSLNCF